MEKTLILSTGNIPKSQKLFFVFMGLVFLLQGFVNLNYNITPSFYSFFQLIVGLVYILAILFYYNGKNRATYIKLTCDEVTFKISPLRKEVVLKTSDIVNLDITNYQLLIESESNSYKISFGNLSYLQRKNELPVFINELRKIRETVLSLFVMINNHGRNK